MKRDVRSRLRKITTMASTGTGVGGRDRKIMKAKPVTLPTINVREAGSCAETETNR